MFTVGFLLERECFLAGDNVFHNRGPTVYSGQQVTLTASTTVPFKHTLVDQDRSVTKDRKARGY